uniref:Uncharacterized protein n=1 Tax=Arundo donax TaxID=35708 RepID=A0A0A9H5R1_ARUDO
MTKPTSRNIPTELQTPVPPENSL